MPAEVDPAALRRVEMELGRVAHDPGYLPALIFPGSLRRLGVAVAVGVLFGVIGLGLAVTSRPAEDQWLIGVAAVLLFGGLAIVGIYGIVRDIGRVALSAAGIHGGSRSEVFVPWSALQDARVLRIRGTSMVGLRVSALDAVRLPRRLRAVSRLNREWFGVDAAVGGPTDGPRATMVTLAIGYYGVDADRRAEVGLTLPTIEQLVEATRPPSASASPAGASDAGA
jgi:hypothetical protein